MISIKIDIMNFPTKNNNDTFERFLFFVIFFPILFLVEKFFNVY